MLKFFVLLMVIVPALEIWIMIEIGRLIGGFDTLVLILLTSIVGAYLARKEASRVWHYAKHQLANGEPPGMSILDGICVFAGGLLLIIPGFVTDVLGLLLVLPPSRRYFRSGLFHLLQKYIEKRRIHFFRW